MDHNPPSVQSIDISDDQSARLLEHIARSTFDDFADDIMSLYGSQQHEDKLETLSSTPLPELRAELDKVRYRILWLEAILKESMLEQELIISVLDSLDNPLSQHV